MPDLRVFLHILLVLVSGSRAVYLTLHTVHCPLLLSLFPVTAVTMYSEKKLCRAFPLMCCLQRTVFLLLFLDFSMKHIGCTVSQADTRPVYHAIRFCCRRGFLKVQLMLCCLRFLRFHLPHLYGSFLYLPLFCVFQFFYGLLCFFPAVL